MPLSIEEIDEIESKQGGSGLRRTLEQTIGENKALQDRVQSYEAQAVIGQGFDLVKPEDLIGAADMAVKAAEVQELRLKERQDVIRDVLAKKGLEGEALDAAVAEFVTNSPAAEVNSSVNELTRIRGTVPATGVNLAAMTTDQKWNEAFKS